jgi:hypothetical protein
MAIEKELATVADQPAPKRRRRWRIVLDAVRDAQWSAVLDAARDPQLTAPLDRFRDARSPMQVYRTIAR